MNMLVYVNRETWLGMPLLLPQIFVSLVLCTTTIHGIRKGIITLDSLPLVLMSSVSFSTISIKLGKERKYNTVRSDTELN